LADTESGDETVYSIVGDHEGAIKEGRIAISAPLARALIGREQGDTVNLRTAKGTREYQIQEVKFIAVDEV
jgi:transcription elongation factor GreA